MFPFLMYTSPSNRVTNFLAVTFITTNSRPTVRSRDWMTTECTVDVSCDLDANSQHVILVDMVQTLT